ncbi:MAG: TolB family protein, partial [Candidatus Neomarinimicrobiota bacterium]
MDGDSLTQLTFGGSNFFPAWSPDGEWIAYDNTNCGSQVEPAPPNSCGILIMKSDGLSKKLIIGGRFPDWSPDGDNLVFVGLGSEIFNVTINDTSDVVQLTSFHQTYTYVSVITPRYNPDGSKIVFCSTTHDWFGIWVMDSSGGNLKRLDENGSYPSWSPDGKNIVYVGPQTTLWIMEADGSNKRQLTFRPKPG